MNENRDTTLPPRLLDIKKEIEGYARGFGLDIYETIFEVLGYDEINMVAAYGGFPNRYPHWRFGMEYEQLSKGYEYGLSKIYEMVINNNPSYAYLLESNMDVDQKLVMAHVFGHVDFFKNNFSFRHTNRKMMDEMANHATRVRRIIDKVGLEPVETFIDRSLSLENLIDQHSPHIKRKGERGEDDEDKPIEVRGFKAGREYMQGFINPREFLEEQRKKLEEERAAKKKFPERPQRDVLEFLLEHAPLERWEAEILSLMREEAYYFAPQGQTKIANEGWACVAGNTRVFTSAGFIEMQNLVAGDANCVSDGDSIRHVYDHNIIRDQPTVTVRTRRGLVLTGSVNHRILLADRSSWSRLDAIAIGERIAVSGGADLWPKGERSIAWRPDVRTRWTMEDAGGDTVSSPTLRNVALAIRPDDYRQGSAHVRRLVYGHRKPVRIPEILDSRLAQFAGYLIGDVHISRVKRHVGLTTGDEPQARAFVDLGYELFGLLATMRWDDGRWRVQLHSETLSDFLVHELGFTSGPSASQKRVPEAVLRSPKHVVAAFLRAYFDCDGYAGKQGVILSTTSDSLAELVQVLLLKFGILSRKRRQKDGCWHVQILGASAAKFATEIGFGLQRKQRALEAYVSNRRWFKEEKWEDEIVSGRRRGPTPVGAGRPVVVAAAAGPRTRHRVRWL